MDTHKGEPYLLFKPLYNIKGLMNVPLIVHCSPGLFTLHNCRLRSCLLIHSSSSESLVLCRLIRILYKTFWISKG